MPAERRLVRTRRPPVRLAHLGLGAFHRSHQAWYTQHADDGWGIAAFTGRSPDAAARLAAQDGLYTLIERGPADDRVEVVESIVAAYDGADAAAWTATLARPDLAVLTVTVTEAGYAPGAPAPRRIAAGLAARRGADAGPIAIVACDNLPANGRTLREAVLDASDDALRSWIGEYASFVDTMVDRITPATTDADRRTARELAGFADAVPVVTEPYAEWVIAGEFPAGRPAWEDAGARFADDATPYEERKLWLLNAGHSLLAYAGRLRGLETIDEAFADDALRAELERLWSEQRAVLDLPAADVDQTLDRLRDRFANARIRHSLEQIARDGAHKIPARILAPLRRRVERGIAPGGAQIAVIRAWLGNLDRFGAEDAASAALAAALRGRDGQALAELAPAVPDSTSQARDRKVRLHDHR